MIMGLHYKILVLAIFSGDYHRTYLYISRVFCLTLVKGVTNKN